MRIPKPAIARLCAVLAVALPGVVLVTTGCDKGARTNAIGKLLNDPGDFMNKDLAIKGRVINSVDPSSGLLGLAAYQVDDGSGAIWVITRAGAPRVGREVMLKARLRRDPLPVNVTIPGLTVTLLDEIERAR